MAPSTDFNNPRLIIAAMFAQHNVHVEQISSLDHVGDAHHRQFVSSRSTPYTKEMTSLFTRLLAIPFKKYDMRKNTLVGKGRHSVYKLSQIDVEEDPLSYGLHLDQIGFVLRHLHELVQ